MLDSEGKELWDGEQFATVHTRDVPKDIAANGETFTFDAKGEIGRFRERGFAGVVVTRGRPVRGGRRRAAGGLSR